MSQMMKLHTCWTHGFRTPEAVELQIFLRMREVTGARKCTC